MGALQESVIIRTSGFGSGGLAVPFTDIGKSRLVRDMDESCCRYSEHVCPSRTWAGHAQVVRKIRCALRKEANLEIWGWVQPTNANSMGRRVRLTLSSKEPPPLLW